MKQVYKYSICKVRGSVYRILGKWFMGCSYLIWVMCCMGSGLRIVCNVLLGRRFVWEVAYGM